MPLAEASCCGTIPLVTKFGATQEIVLNVTKDTGIHYNNFLLTGIMVDVGCGSQRCYVNEFAIAYGVINLKEMIFRMSNKELMDLKASISKSAKAEYQNDPLQMERLTKIIQVTTTKDVTNV
jgi:hypothetical protein